jgi:hypothetical protein
MENLSLVEEMQSLKYPISYVLYGLFAADIWQNLLHIAIHQLQHNPKLALKVKRIVAFYQGFTLIHEHDADLVLDHVVPFLLLQCDHFADHDFALVLVIFQTPDFDNAAHLTRG